MASKIITGISWSFVKFGVSKAFTFVIKLILARLLFPEQFGLVGMAVVFTSIISVFSGMGIGTALVQMHKSKLTNTHYNTAFWTGVVWSVILYLVIFFGVAPFVAWFYDEPLLRWIVPVLSISILSGPLNAIHHVQLTRALNFKKLAIIGIISNLFSGSLSIGLAFMGAGVWALVFNSVASLFIGIPMYFWATGWFPQWEWDRVCFNQILGFGVFTTGTALLGKVVSKIDYLLVGKMVGAEALGAYTLAFVLTDTFRSQLMGVIGQVIYPVYGTYQDDINAIKNYYNKVVKYNCLIIYPIMGILLVLGEQIVFILFGAKWVESIIPLKILSASVIVHLTVNSNLTLLRGMGKANIEFKIQLFKTLFLLAPMIVLGIYFYGINGAAIAILINKIISVFIAQFYLGKYVGLTYVDFLKMISEPLSALLLMISLGYFFQYINVYLTITIIAMLSSYLAVIYYRMRGELTLVYNKIIKLKPRTK